MKPKNLPALEGRVLVQTRYVGTQPIIDMTFDPDMVSPEELRSVYRVARKRVLPKANDRMTRFLEGEA